VFYVHTHTFNGPSSETTRVSRYQKGKTNLDLLKQETVRGSGISWAICKSALRSRQITMPASHHSVFTGRMPFLPPNQQRQSTEGTYTGSQYMDCYTWYSKDTPRDSFAASAYPSKANIIIIILYTILFKVTPFSGVIP